MDPTKLREELTALDEEIRALHADENGELREFTPEQQTTFDEKVAERAKKLALLERHTAVETAAVIPERVEAPTAPNLNLTRSAIDVATDRSSAPKDIIGAAMRALEEVAEDGRADKDTLPHVQRVLRAHMRDTEWARGILVRSTDEYASAWLKIMQHREFDLTAEERTVLGVTTNANGKFLLPTHLDPTIMLTNDGSSNVVRQLARVVTLTDGQPAWNGVTSAGVTASWDGEVAEVSDDTPTFGQPSIATVRAQALVQASISAVEDIAGLAGDVMMLFADAKDRLEGAAHATGAGTTEPMGVFTAVAAVTASRVVSTTAAAIGLVDLNSVYTGLPLRNRRNAQWLANPLYTVAIKTLGTAISASYSGDLRDAPTDRILGKGLVESDDAPTTQTTTALDAEVLFGNFQHFVIVDRPGGMTVEFIPHLFNTSNNLPDGRRAWYATWRNGSDVTDVNAFRLLVDKTSA